MLGTRERSIADMADTPMSRRTYALDLCRAIKTATDQEQPPDMLLHDAMCVRLMACCDESNIWLAEDLHSEQTGDLYPANGRLWRCNSKLCPDCIARQSSQNRKKLQRALDRQKLWTNEDYYFVTLTQVNPDLPILDTRSLMNRAWTLFRKRRYIRRIVAGYVKSEEFTVTPNGVHYHLHLIIRSKFVRYRLFRQLWTESVRQAYEEEQLELNVKTSDKLLWVDIQKTYDIKKAVKEVCKYITKADSWQKIRTSDLFEIIRTSRFPRMFELGGSFAESCEDPQRVLLAPPDLRPILDTEPISDALGHEPAASWRKNLTEYSFFAWTANLQAQIQSTQRARRIDLAKKYPYAAFQTLKEWRSTSTLQETAI